jgi:hypothetical protein
LQIISQLFYAFYIKTVESRLFLGDYFKNQTKKQKPIDFFFPFSSLNISESSKHFRSFSFFFLQVWRFIPIFANVIFSLTLKTKLRMVT